VARISVIIPGYNAAGTVARAIESALAQTVKPLEIFVVDDGSKDGTAEVAETFGGCVKVLRKANGGPASARNLGARHATGDWLAMLDADDWWFPAKTERQLDFAREATIGAVHSPSEDVRGPVPAELSFDDLWRQNWVMNSSIMVRRTAFEAMGGFIEDRKLISVEDYNLWIRLAASGWRIVTCPEVLTHYTRGIGISSDLERFLGASLYNLDVLERVLAVSPEKLRAKRRQIYEDFGRTALFERKIGVARKLFREALAIQPSTGNALRLAAAHLPAPVLDARRRALSLFGEDDPSEVAHDRPPVPGPGCVEADFGRAGPFLLVVIDSEEEFDWETVPSHSVSVKSMRYQDRAQRIFERFGVVPTYAVDYAVASQHEGFAPLAEYLADGHCEIGAQLHPWLNPPVVEQLVKKNSFPGNLPPSLEFEKIRVLTETIEQNLGVSPILYRAGRYGLGGNTARFLCQLGYRIDCSVRPFYRSPEPGGPDYRAAPSRPFWFGPGGQLLEIPVTVGVLGALSAIGRQAYSMTSTPLGQTLRMPGIFARAGLLDRIQLTPEGISLEEAKRVTRTMLARDNHRIFVLSYHSPSLEPGNTPYVRTSADLQRFLHWLEAYLEFFFTEIGGIAATPGQVFDLAAGLSAPRAPASVPVPVG